MWIDHKDEIAYGYYTPTNRSFGVSWGKRKGNGPTRIGEWITCREEFHNYNRRRLRFYFCHRFRPLIGRNISEFFDKIEDRLKLVEKDRSRFGPTDKEDVTWVEMSEWWKCHSMRRSLFTALLRQSIDYNAQAESNNFDAVLYEGQYTSGTRAALNRFFEGNTYYWGGHCGWVQAFNPSEWDWVGYTKPKIDVTNVLRDYPRPLPQRKPKKQVTA
jgi:hypothetical protein